MKVLTALCFSLAGCMLAIALLLIREPPEERESYRRAESRTGRFPASVRDVAARAAPSHPVDLLRIEAERLAMTGTVDAFLQLEWLCSAASRHAERMTDNLPWGEPDSGLDSYLRDQVGKSEGVALRLVTAALTAHGGDGLGSPSAAPYRF